MLGLNALFLPTPNLFPMRHMFGGAHNSLEYLLRFQRPAPRDTRRLRLVLVVQSRIAFICATETVGKPENSYVD
jgi:hypothetical protein